MIDLQASKGLTLFDLDEVGIRGLKYPLTAWDRTSGESQRVVANWNLAVDLKAEARGTHMSRFLAELHEAVAKPFDCDAAFALATQIRERQGARRAQVRCHFDWVRLVESPVTKIPSFASYRIGFHAASGTKPKKTMILTVLGTSLCPCSKAISARGAHNQRTKFRVGLDLDPKAAAPAINDVIALMESCASARLYPLLKRDDEKYLTEYAYDNPAFVEDLARNIAGRLSSEVKGLKSGTVKVVNMESIHAHDCFAKLRFSPTTEK